jgi:hypothetical protein
MQDPRIITMDADNDDGIDKDVKSSFTSWLGRGTTVPKIAEANDIDDDDNDNDDATTNHMCDDANNDDTEKLKNSVAFQRRHTIAKTNPFHLVARSCFSFDAYDTSMDDQYEYTLSPHDHSLLYSSTTGGTFTTASTSIDDGSSHILQRHLPMPELDHPTRTKPMPRPSVDIRSSESSSIFKRSSLSPPDIGYSASWDVSSNTGTSAYSPTKSRLYPRHPYSKTAPFRRPSQSDYRRMFRPNVYHHRWGSNVKSINQEQQATLSASSSLSSPKRSVPTNDERNDYSDDSTQQLKTPQRIEIERNDAIDILACLVERGVSWKQPQHEADRVSSVPAEASINDADPKTDEQTANDFDDDEVPSPADIVAIVEELQGLSLAEENLSDYNSKNTVAHQKRKLALEELVRSHEYAMEMKRASQSASSWLKSIGRSQSSSPTKSAPASPARNLILSGSVTPPTSNSPNNNRDENLRSEGSVPIHHKMHQAAGEDSSASDNIDLLTLKAMLRSSQIEAKEKSDLADRLNEELVRFFFK